MKETLEVEDIGSSDGTLGTAVDVLKVSRPTLLITRTYVEGMPGLTQQSIC